MSAHGQRIVAFGGSAVAIEYLGPQAAALVDFLYRHVPTDGEVAPHVTYRVESGSQIALYRGDALIYEGGSEAVVADLLLGYTCYHLSDRSTGGLLLHAAALAWQGHGLVLPGAVGAGKTTLAAWLVTQGLDYLTDELVFVPDGARTFQAFTRPLNLKKTSWPALRPHFDVEGHAEQSLRTCCVALIPPTLLRPAAVWSEPPLSLIVFPHYAPDQALALRPLSKAQTGLALMQCLVNARNLPDHGFAEVARLARTAPAYDLRYSGFDHLAAQIAALLQAL